MSERKNIDRLFQEKFKDFEANPSEEVWANIEAKLDEKKRRRVIPFWWKLSGVAAILLLGFLLSKSFSSGEIKTENPLVNGKNSNPSNPQNIEKEKTQPDELKSNSSNLNSNPTVQNSSNESSGDIKKNTVSEEKKTIKKTVPYSTSSVAEGGMSNDRSLKNKFNSNQHKIPASKSVFEKNYNQEIAHNTKNRKQSIAEKDINNSKQENQIVQTEASVNKNKEENKESIKKAPINLDDLKENNISKIATKEIEKKVNDTVKKNSVANNVLEELLNEKESKVKQESKRNRWQLTSNVAPIFLGSVSNGSPIDSTLSKNSKSYNTNVGFGIGVSYAVNSKFSIRTGLNKLKMNYNTNDIVFFTGIQAKMLTNVTPTSSSAMIHVQSDANTIINTASETGLLPFENSFVHENKGSLKQEIGYIEMPVEMTYAILDKKFGFKIIGGFSTLFLQENRLTLLSDDRDTVLGQANNLNDIHFSTNLGLGLKYTFMKSFEFNIEPTVKYQLNTFSSNAGNFKPYLFGIYSGISYRF
ncbi:hypothetical protein [Flavobacterium sp. N1994]|uniref:hypothetical protein n=1 Tax=Flavobacterium sp. N1994 TaxID=2986827 RepID=UPI002222C4BA|nr:hypothetical protein [Flavobacterium sp. N1994]